MRVLIGPVSAAEARALLATDAAFLDMKNTVEGSYGAASPALIKDVATMALSSDKIVSATIGDLSEAVEPGTAALAAFGASSAGADYLKCGLAMADVAAATRVMSAIVAACKALDRKIHVIAGSFADTRVAGLSPEQLIDVAVASGADGVMLDTSLEAKANGEKLLGLLTEEALSRFVADARAKNLHVVFAGSIGLEDVPTLRAIDADIVGIRGAVCANGDRGTQIDPTLVKEFVDAANGRTAARAPVAEATELVHA